MSDFVGIMAENVGFCREYVSDFVGNVSENVGIMADFVGKCRILGVVKGMVYGTFSIFNGKTPQRVS